MAKTETMECKHCKEEVKVGAKRCPHCQGDLRSWPARHPVLTFLGIIFILTFVLFGNAMNSSSTTSTEKPVDVVSATFMNYEYEILHQQGDNKYSATFEKNFLPRNDAILTGAMMDAISRTYGKNKLTNLQPQIVERNGINLVMFEGTDVNYYFSIIKEDTGEVNSFVFWAE